MKNKYQDRSRFLFISTLLIFFALVLLVLPYQKETGATEEIAVIGESLPERMLDMDFNNPPARTMVEDKTRFSNHGILHGNPFRNPDEGPQRDGAYYFDGRDDYIEIPHSMSLTPNRITISLWAKNDFSVWDHHGSHLSKRDNYIMSPNEGAKGYTFDVVSAPKHDPEGMAWIRTETSIPPNDIRQWHHYVFIYDYYYLWNKEIRQSGNFPMVIEQTCHEDKFSCALKAKADGSFITRAVREINLCVDGACKVERIDEFNIPITIPLILGDTASIPELSLNKFHEFYDGPREKMLPHNNPLFIGYDGQAYARDRYFRGHLDNIKIYAKALTNEQVKELFFSEVNTKVIDINFNMVLDDPDLVVNDTPHYFNYIENHGTIPALNAGPKGPSKTGDVRFGDHARRFDGIDDYFITSHVRPPDYYNLLMPQPRKETLSLWIKAEAPGIIVSELGQMQIDTGYHYAKLGINNNQELKGNFWNCNKNLSFGTIEYNKWYHVALVYDEQGPSHQGRERAFLNGKEVATIICPTRAPPQEQYLAFGATDSTLLGGFDNAGYFKGFLDNILVYHMDLTSEQIKNIYEEQKSSFTSLPLPPDIILTPPSLNSQDSTSTDMADAILDPGSIPQEPLGKYLIQNPSAFAVRDGLTLIAKQGKDIEMIDTQNQAQLGKITTVLTDNEIKKIIIDDDQPEYALLLEGNPNGILADKTWFRVLDINAQKMLNIHPTEPDKSYYELAGEAIDMAVRIEKYHNNYAYILTKKSGNTRLYILDISDPSQPKLINFPDPASSDTRDRINYKNFDNKIAKKIQLAKDEDLQDKYRLYIAFDDMTIKILEAIDTESRPAPKSLAIAEKPNLSVSWGSKLFTARKNSNEFRYSNVTDPENPETIIYNTPFGQSTPGGKIQDLSASPDNLYVVTDKECFLIFNHEEKRNELSPPSSFTDLTNCQKIRNPFDYDDGGYELYLLNVNSNNVYQLNYLKFSPNTTTPYEIKFTYDLPAGFIPENFEVANDIAYFSEGNQLLIIDANDQSNVKKIGSLFYTHPITNIQPLNSYVIISTTNPQAKESKLHALDPRTYLETQDPVHPPSFLANVSQIYRHGKRLYLVDKGEKIFPIDLTDAAEPKVQTDKVLTMEGLEFIASVRGQIAIVQNTMQQMIQALPNPGTSVINNPVDSGLDVGSGEDEEDSNGIAETPYGVINFYEAQADGSLQRSSKYGTMETTGHLSDLKEISKGYLLALMKDGKLKIIPPSNLKPGPPEPIAPLSNILEKDLGLSQEAITSKIIIDTERRYTYILYEDLIRNEKGFLALDFTDPNDEKKITMNPAEIKITKYAQSIHTPLTLKIFKYNDYTNTDLVKKTYVALLNSHSLEIIDITTPADQTTLRKVAEFDNFTSAVDLEVKNKKAFLALEDGDVLQIDLSNPKNPQQVYPNEPIKFSPMNHSLSRIRVFDKYIYGTHSHGLDVKKSFGSEAQTIEFADQTVKEIHKDYRDIFIVTENIANNEGTQVHIYSNQSFLPTQEVSHHLTKDRVILQKEFIYPTHGKLTRFIGHTDDYLTYTNEDTSSTQKKLIIQDVAKNIPVEIASYPTEDESETPLLTLDIRDMQIKKNKIYLTTEKELRIISAHYNFWIHDIGTYYAHEHNFLNQFDISDDDYIYYINENSHIDETEIKVLDVQDLKYDGMREPSVTQGQQFFNAPNSQTSQIIYRGNHLHLLTPNSYQIVQIDKPDTDGDQIPNTEDNCDHKASLNNSDTDSDGKGDICDRDPIIDDSQIEDKYEEGYEFPNIYIIQCTGTSKECQSTQQQIDDLHGTVFLEYSHGSLNNFKFHISDYQTYNELLKIPQISYVFLYEPELKYGDRLLGQYKNNELNTGELIDLTITLFPKFAQVPFRTTDEVVHYLTQDLGITLYQQNKVAPPTDNPTQPTPTFLFITIPRYQSKIKEIALMPEIAQIAETIIPTRNNEDGIIPSEIIGSMVLRPNLLDFEPELGAITPLSLKSDIGSSQRILTGADQTAAIIDNVGLNRVNKCHTLQKCNEQDDAHTFPCDLHGKTIFVGSFSEKEEKIWATEKLISEKGVIYKLEDHGNITTCLLGGYDFIDMKGEGDLYTIGGVSKSNIMFFKDDMNNKISFFPEMLFRNLHTQNVQIISYSLGFDRHIAEQKLETKKEKRFFNTSNQIVDHLDKAIKLKNLIFFKAVGNYGWANMSHKKDEKENRTDDLDSERNKNLISVGNLTADKFKKGGIDVSIFAPSYRSSYGPEKLKKYRMTPIISFPGTNISVSSLYSEDPQDNMDKFTFIGTIGQESGTSFSTPALAAEVIKLREGLVFQDAGDPNPKATKIIAAMLAGTMNPIERLDLFEKIHPPKGLWEVIKKTKELDAYPTDDLLINYENYGEYISHETSLTDPTGLNSLVAPNRRLGYGPFFLSKVLLPNAYMHGHPQATVLLKIDPKKIILFKSDAMDDMLFNIKKARKITNGTLSAQHNLKQENFYAQKDNPITIALAYFDTTHKISELENKIEVIITDPGNRNFLVEAWNADKTTGFLSYKTGPVDSHNPNNFKKGEFKPLATGRHTVNIKFHPGLPSDQIDYHLVILGQGAVYTDEDIYDIDHDSQIQVDLKNGPSNIGINFSFIILPDKQSLENAIEKVERIRLSEISSFIVTKFAMTDKNGLATANISPQELAAKIAWDERDTVPKEVLVTADFNSDKQYDPGIDFHNTFILKKEKKGDPVVHKELLLIGEEEEEEGETGDYRIKLAKTTSDKTGLPINMSQGNPGGEGESYLKVQGSFPPPSPSNVVMHFVFARPSNEILPDGVSIADIDLFQDSLPQVDGQKYGEFTISQTGAIPADTYIPYIPTDLDKRCDENNPLKDNCEGVVVFRHDISNPSPDFDPKTDIALPFKIIPEVEYCSGEEYQGVCAGKITIVENLNNSLKAIYASVKILIRFLTIVHDQLIEISAPKIELDPGGTMNIINNLKIKSNTFVFESSPFQTVDDDFVMTVTGDAEVEIYPYSIK